MLSVDHVSLTGTIADLERDGFRITRTPADPTHARIHLDRSYLELRTDAPAPALRGVGWFLRPDDPAAIIRQLTAAGVMASEPSLYLGSDGRWSDITVGDGRCGAAAPVITHRIDWADWPPPLDVPHPNGAVTIVGVELGLGDPAALAALLTTLGAQTQSTPFGPRLVLGAIEITIAASGHPAPTAVVLGCQDGRRLRLALAA